MIDDWPMASFEAELRDRARVLVLFYADWCPFSASFLPIFDAADLDANVPFTRADIAHPLDPRWDDHRIISVPTLVYFEHGEEMERTEAVRQRGLTKRDMDEMLETIHGLEEEPRLPKRMHGPRRS